MTTIRSRVCVTTIRSRVCVTTIWRKGFEPNQKKGIIMHVEKNPSSKFNAQSYFVMYFVQIWKSHVKSQDVWRILKEEAEWKTKVKITHGENQSCRVWALQKSVSELGPIPNWDSRFRNQNRRQFWRQKAGQPSEGKSVFEIRHSEILSIVNEFQISRRGRANFGNIKEWLSQDVETGM